MIVGFLSAFSGIMETTRIYSAYPLQGEGMNLLAITATVIGGTALTGGLGNIIGTVGGALLIEIIDAGLLFLRAPPFWFRLFIGLLIIIVVSWNMYLRRN
jgi:simple sugar transport system permease protein